MYEREPAVPYDISVETALNSRCSSDNDGDQQTFHWGLYDPESAVPLEAIHALDRGAQIPRFTYYPLDVDMEARPVVFAMSVEAAGCDRKWLHVESGMQQQAFHLVCSALGIGTCILNLGTEGRRLNEDLWGNVRMALQAMRTSYEGSFWISRAPDDWVRDPSLSDPRRESSTPLMKAVEDISTDADGRDAVWEDVSQLLWAARGRTPHLYMGKRWGMTIPTWAGGQSIAGLYAVTQDGVFTYVNWRGDAPTHALARVGQFPGGLESGERARIVMALNEDTGRACWEVGYMLESMLLQSSALGIRYRAELLDEDAAAVYESAGIASALAVLRV